VNFKELCIIVCFHELIGYKVYCSYLGAPLAKIPCY